MRDNKVIAEFMGVNVINLDNVRKNKNPYFSSADGYLEGDLKYHTSWDWLMPVVQKCYKIDNEEGFDNLVDAVSTLDIDGTYLAVVKFIKSI